MDEFNVDEFCKEMQTKAKQKGGKSYIFPMSDSKMRFEVTINGKKSIHDYPCGNQSCDICIQITALNNQMNDMHRSLNDMFNDLFGEFGF